MNFPSAFSSLCVQAIPEPFQLPHLFPRDIKHKNAKQLPAFLEIYLLKYLAASAGPGKQIPPRDAHVGKTHTATQFRLKIDENVKTFRGRKGVSPFLSFRKMGTQKCFQKLKAPPLVPSLPPGFTFLAFFQKCLVQIPPAPTPACSHHRNTGTYL